MYIYNDNYDKTVGEKSSAIGNENDLVYLIWVKLSNCDVTFSNNGRKSQESKLTLMHTIIDNTNLLQNYKNHIYEDDLI